MGPGETVESSIDVQFTYRGPDKGESLSLYMHTDDDNLAGCEQYPERTETVKVLLERFNNNLAEHYERKTIDLDNELDE